MCTGIQELYYASFKDDGSAFKENSAWITEAGMILLPNDGNTNRYSENDELSIRQNSTTVQVEYPKGLGNWLDVYAHVHTHPNSYTNSCQDSRPGDGDKNFASTFGNKISYFIIGATCTYEYYSNASGTSRGNSNSFISCNKSLSTYY